MQDDNSRYVNSIATPMLNRLNRQRNRKIIHFLCFILSVSEGILTVRNWPRPASVRQILALLKFQLQKGLLTDDINLVHVLRFLPKELERRRQT